METLPNEIWLKERSDPERFFSAAASFIYSRPRHDDDGGGNGWWCAHPRVMRSLLLVMYQQDPRVEEFRRETERQLSVCPKCIRAYVEQRRIWKEEMSLHLDINAAISALRQLDLKRIRRQWKSGSCEDGTTARKSAHFALLEVILDVDMCFDNDVVRAVEEYFMAMKESSDIQSWANNFFLEEGRFAPGLYALCLSASFKVRNWARTMLKEGGKIVEKAKLENVDTMFTKILSDLNEEEAKDTNFFISKRMVFAGAEEFWEGLKFILELYSAQMLNDLLLTHPRLPRLLIFGFQKRKSFITHTAAIFQLLLDKLGYKFWLVQNLTLTPKMLVESIIDAYKSKALSLNEKKALLSLFKPLTTSLKAFDPTVVQETYDVALTFLSQVADVWKSGTLFNSDGEKRMVRFGQSAFLDVALAGYEMLRPNSPAMREVWVRVLFQTLSDGNEYEKAFRLLRVVMLTVVSSAFNILPHALGSISLHSLPQAFDNEGLPFFGAEPRLASSPYLWNGIAAFRHRRQQATDWELVEELRALLDIYQYVHFVHRPDVAIFTEQQQLALSTILQIQDALSAYFTKVAQKVGDGTQNATGIKSALAPMVGSFLLCSYDSLRRSCVNLLRAVYLGNSADERPIELMRKVLADAEHRRVLDGMYSSIEKLNHLRILSTSPTMRLAYQWLPVVFQACDSDATKFAEVRQSLAREGLFTFVCNTLEYLPEDKESETFQTVAIYVLNGLKKIWELTFFDTDDKAQHSRLLALLLHWGAIPEIRREWHRVVLEVVRKFGAGGPACNFAADKLLELSLDSPLSEDDRSMLTKLYPSLNDNYPVDINASDRLSKEKADCSQLNFPVIYLDDDLDGERQHDPEARGHELRVQQSEREAISTAPRIEPSEQKLRPLKAPGPRKELSEEEQRQVAKKERVRLEMQEKMKNIENMSLKPVQPRKLIASYSLGESEGIRDAVLRKREQEKQRQQKRQRVRNLEDLHDLILQWTVASLLDTQIDQRLEVEEYPSSFENPESYSSFWEPLLIEEVRASLRKSYEEMQEKVRIAGDPERGPFVQFTVTTPPEKRDRTTFITVECDKTRADKVVKQGKEEFYPSTGDIALLQAETNEGPVDIVTLVADSNLFGGNGRRLYIKMLQSSSSVSFVPGKELFVAKLTSLVTHQRQYAALWSAGEIHPTILQNILNPRSGINTMGKAADEALSPAARHLLGVYRKAGKLNESQYSAVRNTVVNIQNYGSGGGFTLLQGPPGTGKTTTIISLLSTLLAKSLYDESDVRGRRRQKILVCAPSNGAVDELLVRVMQKGLDHPDGVGKYSPMLVRVGGGTTIDEVETVTVSSLLARAGSSAENIEEQNSVEKKWQEKEATYRRLLSVRQSISAVDLKRQELRVEMKKDVIIVEDGIKDSELEAAREAEKRADERLLIEDRKLTEELSRLHAQKNDLMSQLEIAKKSVDSAKEESALSKVRRQSEVINTATIVFSTLNSAGHQMLKSLMGGFDCVIIDEAAQAVEPEVLIPLSVAGSKRVPHCVMVGDAKQLPATVLSTSAAVLSVYKRSLFERLEEARDGTSNQVLMLRTQYRMHPLLSAFPSRHFYNSRLEDAAEVGGKAYHRKYHNDGGRRFGPLTFIDTSLSNEHGEERTLTGSLRNRYEVKVCIALLSSLAKLYPTERLRDAIAILTPYKTQVNDMKLALKQQTHLKGLNIEVCTVDGIQGREKDIVILSTVRSGASSRAGIGFVKDIRRMNVAITRAKYTLVVVGNAKLLSKGSAAWAAQVDFCKRIGCIRTVHNRMESLFPETMQPTMKPASHSSEEIRARREKIDEEIQRFIRSSEQALVPHGSAEVVRRGTNRRLAGHVGDEEKLDGDWDASRFETEDGRGTSVTARWSDSVVRNQDGGVDSRKRSSEKTELDNREMAKKRSTAQDVIQEGGRASNRMGEENRRRELVRTSGSAREIGLESSSLAQDQLISSEQSTVAGRNSVVESNKAKKVWQETDLRTDVQKEHRDVVRPSSDVSAGKVGPKDRRYPTVPQRKYELAPQRQLGAEPGVEVSSGSKQVSQHTKRPKTMKYDSATHGKPNQSAVGNATEVQRGKGEGGHGISKSSEKMLPTLASASRVVPPRNSVRSPHRKSLDPRDTVPSTSRPTHSLTVQKRPSVRYHGQPQAIADPVYQPQIYATSNPPKLVRVDSSKPMDTSYNALRSRPINAGQRNDQNPTARKDRPLASPSHFARRLPPASSPSSSTARSPGANRPHLPANDIRRLPPETLKSTGPRLPRSPSTVTYPRRNTTPQIQPSPFLSTTVSGPELSNNTKRSMTKKAIRGRIMDKLKK